jgi:drug/metabolite transporter (DMT)-like permease
MSMPAGWMLRCATVVRGTIDDAQPFAMTRHTASGRWQRGLVLTLATAAFWSTLPVALKFSLHALDAFTLTWFRFLFAALALAGWLGARGEFGALRGLPRQAWLLLWLAALMLTGNFVFYLLGVQYTTPGNAQLLIQLAPLGMMLGGIAIFRERFGAWQWGGMVLMIGGLGLFFRDQLHATAHEGVLVHADSTHYLVGSAFVVLGAMVWAAYALAQKQLLMRLRSPVVLAFIYVIAALALWPFAHPHRLLALTGLQWLVLGYCALNTLGAYGAFAEALAHWEASRVSAVLATTPLLCIAVVDLAHALWPTQIAAEQIGWLGWLGAAIAVGGSIAVSLLGRARSPDGLAIAERSVQ